MHAKDDHHEFEISIDGETYTVEDKTTAASQVLAFAGKSYDSFYLVEMKSGREHTEYKVPGQEIKLHQGMTFITLHVGPTPVS